MLPKPLRLGLWGKSGQDEGLDATKRFLHVTTDALVLEVEGEDEVSATLHCCKLHEDIDLTMIHVMTRWRASYRTRTLFQ